MKDPRCARDRDDGVTGAEYALVVSFVSMVLVAAVVVLGNNFISWVGNLTDQLGSLLG